MILRTSRVASETRPQARGILSLTRSTAPIPILFILSVSLSVVILYLFSRFLIPGSSLPSTLDRDPPLPLSFYLFLSLSMFISLSLCLSLALSLFISRFVSANLSLCVCLSKDFSCRINKKDSTIHDPAGRAGMLWARLGASILQTA